MARGDTDGGLLEREKVTPEGAKLSRTELLKPGWKRSVCGKGWRFRNSRGGTISGAIRARCLALAIPPAWTNVWINPDPKGHIQAVGEDAAGRKQYIYHPDWSEAAQAAKYADLLRFADGLPIIRRRVKATLVTPEDDRAFALAAIVRLMDVAGLRVGHERYRSLSGAIGATTLKSKHVRLSRDHVRLAFPSKSGQSQTIEIEDPELIGALEALCSTPGKDVFQADGRCVTAEEVNAYIQTCMGAPFTAKDFRTWGGSVAASSALRHQPCAGVKQVVEAAADWLGNTPAIARKSYVHPAVLAAAAEDTVEFVPSGPSRLRADERACYGLIQNYSA